MESYDYCIIGGGSAGIGFIDRLLEEGKKNIILFEGRNELLYTLSFMPFIKQTSPLFTKEASGSEFKELLLEKNRPDTFLSLSSRLIGTNLENKEIVINENGEKNRSITYKKLIIATGGIQSIYGKQLLPGYRGSGIFSAYQISEMLSLYDFIPGKQLAVLGESFYALETYKLAQKKGIAAVLLSNTEQDEAVSYAAVLKLEGEEHINGITVQMPDASTRHFAIDSLAVDGTFIMEHKMRELLDIEWDIDRWQLFTQDNQSHPVFPDVHIIGDAWKPEFNFMHQYENGFKLAGRI